MFDVDDAAGLLLSFLKSYLALVHCFVMPNIMMIQQYTMFDDP
jgi:hypothetical protein